MLRINEIVVVQKSFRSWSSLQLIITSTFRFVDRVPDEQYREAIESCAAFNIRLLADAKMRHPYLDSQTGIALEPRRSLWVTPSDRSVQATTSITLCSDSSLLVYQNFLNNLIINVII